MPDRNYIFIAMALATALLLAFLMGMIFLSAMDQMGNALYEGLHPALRNGSWQPSSKGLFMWT